MWWVILIDALAWSTFEPDGPFESFHDALGYHDTIYPGADLWVVYHNSIDWIVYDNSAAGLYIGTVDISGAVRPDWKFPA